jgi:hypothetical protein
MNPTRTVEPELLDSMPSDDPRAMRARRDLRRVNILMGHASIFERILRHAISPRRLPIDIVELGAGDGTLMLRLAHVLASRWPHVRLHLVDRNPVVSDETFDNFATLGWQAEVVEADAMEWTSTMPQSDLVMANLFLHHFTDLQLIGLFRHIAGKTAVFAACEPRRSPVAAIGSHLLGLAGCGPVARYDAVVSVRAGFAGTELSALWPEKNCWQLREGKAGLFTHTFIARRSSTSDRPAQP